MKILVADDDPVSRRLMERTLQRSGYEVITANNGAEALEALSGEGSPRLALLDWMMPELDGPEVCRRVRRRQGQPYVYITLLTSKLSNDDIVTGLEAGSDDYLTKPCNPDELKARLRTGERILRLEDGLVEAREEMRFRATHDAMTGLWNQGTILDLVRDALAESAWDRVPVTLLLCDIDHFKRVNDVHGHLTGNEALRQIAQRLEAAVEPLDLVGRYGGEEFLILLRNCAEDQVADRSERVRDAIAALPFAIDSGSLHMSMSVGALAVNWEAASLPMELHLKKADTALYRAKSEGRNRVICANAASA